MQIRHPPQMVRQLPINPQLIKSPAMHRPISHSPPQANITFQPIEIINNPQPVYRQAMQYSQAPQNVVRMEQINRSSSNSRIVNQQSAIEYLNISGNQNIRSQGSVDSRKAISPRGMPNQNGALSPRSLPNAAILPQPQFQAFAPKAEVDRHRTSIMHRPPSNFIQAPRPSSIPGQAVESQILVQSKSVERPPSNRVIFSTHNQPVRVHVLNTNPKPLSSDRMSQPHQSPRSAQIQESHPQHYITVQGPRKEIGQERRNGEKLRVNGEMRKGNMEMREMREMREQYSETKKGYTEVRVEENKRKGQNQQPLKVYKSYDEYLREKEIGEKQIQGSLEIIEPQGMNIHGSESHNTGSYLEVEDSQQSLHSIRQGQEHSRNPTQSYTHSQQNSYISSNREDNIVEEERKNSNMYSQGSNNYSQGSNMHSHSQNKYNQGSKMESQRSNSNLQGASESNMESHNSHSIRQAENSNSHSQGYNSKQVSQNNRSGSNNSSYNQGTSERNNSSKEDSNMTPIHKVTANIINVSSSTNRNAFARNNQKLTPESEEVIKNINNNFSVIKEHTIDFSEEDRDRISSIKTNPDQMNKAHNTEKPNLLTHEGAYTTKPHPQKAEEAQVQASYQMSRSSNANVNTSLEPMEIGGSPNYRRQESHSRHERVSLGNNRAEQGFTSYKSQKIIQNMKSNGRFINIMNYEENEEELGDWREMVEKIYARELQEGLRRINEVYTRSSRI